MSYDLQLLPRDRVGEYLRRYEEQDPDSVEINPGPIVREREEWKRGVRDALITADPRFMQFPFRYDAIARMDAITEDEARVRYRHFELNLRDDDPTGIQIIIFDDTVSVSVAYWHAGEAARCAFEQVWRYLAVIESAGGLATHDPQLDRVLDLANDLDLVVNRYLRVIDRLPEILAQHFAAKKP